VVYLIGCDHRKAQTYRNGSSLTDAENSEQAELKKLILAAAACYKPELIAEEANTTILRSTQWHSVVYEAALNHRLVAQTSAVYRQGLLIEPDQSACGHKSACE
jgi:hypothetical protein